MTSTPEFSPTVIVSIGTAVVTSIIAPYVKKIWIRNDRRSAVSSAVEVARMEAADKFQDRLLRRLEELEARMSEADKQREERIAEFAKMRVELSRIEKIASDLNESNRLLDTENSSLKAIIIDLNAEVINLRGSIQDLQSQLISFSCDAADCKHRNSLVMPPRLKMNVSRGPKIEPHL